MWRLLLGIYEVRQPQGRLGWCSGNAEASVRFCAAQNTCAGPCLQSLPGQQLARNHWESFIGHSAKKGFPGVSVVKNPTAMQETRVRPLVGNIPCRRKWQPTPVFLPGESPWTEEPGGLQSAGLQRVGHNWVTKHSPTQHIKLIILYILHEIWDYFFIILLSIFQIEYAWWGQGCGFSPFSTPSVTNTCSVDMCRINELSWCEFWWPLTFIDEDDSICTTNKVRILKKLASSISLIQAVMSKGRPHSVLWSWKISNVGGINLTPYSAPHHSTLAPWPFFVSLRHAKPIPISKPLPSWSSI